MNRRSFLKGLLAVSVAAATPKIFSTDLYTHASHDVVRDVVNVYSINDLPEPMDGVIYFEGDTTYNFMNPLVSDMKLSLRY